MLLVRCPQRSKKTSSKKKSDKDASQSGKSDVKEGKEAAQPVSPDTPTTPVPVTPSGTTQATPLSEALASLGGVPNPSLTPQPHLDDEAAALAAASATAAAPAPAAASALAAAAAPAAAALALAALVPPPAVNPVPPRRGGAEHDPSSPPNLNRRGSSSKLSTRLASAGKAVIALNRISAATKMAVAPVRVRRYSAPAALGWPTAVPGVPYAARDNVARTASMKKRLRLSREEGVPSPLDARRRRASEVDMSINSRDLAVQRNGSIDDYSLQLFHFTTVGDDDVFLPAASLPGNSSVAKHPVGSALASDRVRRMSSECRMGKVSPARPNARRVSRDFSSGGIADGADPDVSGIGAESEFEIRSTVARLHKDGISPEEAEWLIKTLREHFLFASMPVDQLLKAVRHMEKLDCPVGTSLVHQGDGDADDFFIISSGNFEVVVLKKIDAKPAPVVVAHLGASATFGERALLYNSTRTATVRSTEPSQAFKLSRAAYQMTLVEGCDVITEEGNVANAADDEYKDSTVRLPILRQFPWLHDQIRPMHRGRVVAALSNPISVSAGDPLLRSGQVGGVLLMILKGEVQFTGDAHKMAREEHAWRASSLGELCTSGTLGPGDALAIGRPGDEALLATLHATITEEAGGAPGSGDGGHNGALKLLGGSKHHCAAVALTDAEIMLISMNELISLVADAPSVLSSREGVRALLQNTPWCHDVSRQELDALAFAFKPVEMLESDVVIAEGSEADALHLLVAGELKVTRRKPDGRDVLVFKAAPGDVLGEKSIATATPAMATVTTEKPSVTLCLTRDAYASSLPRRMQPRIQQKRYASQISSTGFETLSELHVIAVVGQGAFARVALVRHKGDQQVYALKKIERSRVGDGHVRKQIMNERFVMGDVDHPFIAKLHATFKTSLSLFMVLEPCLGGELFSYMQRLDILPEKDARFYGCCVASALEHLHRRNVIYRDLKPENVMIGNNGFVKVIDFGFAKRVHLRTYTLCGTPEYLAPEMVMVRGHGKGVDWWALGVLLYEMVMGGAPHIIHPVTKRPQYDLPPNLLYQAILSKDFELYFPECAHAQE